MPTTAAALLWRFWLARGPLPVGVFVSMPHVDEALAAVSERENRRVAREGPHLPHVHSEHLDRSREHSERSTDVSAAGTWQNARGGKSWAMCPCRPRLMKCSQCGSE